MSEQKLKLFHLYTTNWEERAYKAIDSIRPCGRVKEYETVVVIKTQQSNYQHYLDVLVYDKNHGFVWAFLEKVSDKQWLTPLSC